MKQKTLSVLIFLMLTATFLTGCEDEPPKPQAVTMNMVTVTEATGISEEIKKHTEEINQLFSEEMKALSIDYRNEIKAKRNSFGDNPSEEDEQEIKTLEGQLNKQFIEFRKEGRAINTEAIIAIRQAYLDDIMSAAQMIALEHGASIILGAKRVIWSDSSVDITDEVIEQMSDGIDPQPADPVATDL
jgi:Skp family chaperone for outer membrane proteins